jgi:hypothetical protein
MPRSISDCWDELTACRLIPTCLFHDTSTSQVRKTAPFFEFSLCLSRACLGKMIVFVYKWLKNAVFRRWKFVRSGAKPAARKKKKPRRRRGALGGSPSAATAAAAAGSSAPAATAASGTGAGAEPTRVGIWALLRRGSQGGDHNSDHSDEEDSSNGAGKRLFFAPCYAKPRAFLLRQARDKQRKG